MDEIVPSGAQLGHLFDRFFRALGDPRFSRLGGKVPRASIRGDGRVRQTRRGTPRGRRDERALRLLLKNDEEQRRQERRERKRGVTTARRHHHHRMYNYTRSFSGDFYLDGTPPFFLFRVLKMIKNHKHCMI